MSREPAGLLRELARRRSRRPTAVAWNRPAPATTKLPESTSSSGCLVDGSASPVSSDSSTSSPSTSRTTPSDGIWSPVRSSRRSSSTTRRRRRSRWSAPSRTARRDGCAEHRELVELALGPHLLDDADQRVGDEDEAERGRPGRRPEHQDHHEHRAEDRVEAGEDVGPHDLGERAAGALAGVVQPRPGRRARRPRPRSGRRVRCGAGPPADCRRPGRWRRRGDRPVARR